MANIAQGEAECYICHETLIKRIILSNKESGSVLLYFTLTIVSLKYNSLVILTHLLNKYPLIKCVNGFYNYPTIQFNFKQYGSYRTVKPFDLPMQNTINIHTTVI